MAPHPPAPSPRSTEEKGGLQYIWEEGDKERSGRCHRDSAAPAKPHTALLVDRYRTPLTVQRRSEAVLLARVFPLPGRASIGQKSWQLYVATQDVTSASGQYCPKTLHDISTRQKCPGIDSSLVEKCWVEK